MRGKNKKFGRLLVLKISLNFNYSLNNPFLSEAQVTPGFQLSPAVRNPLEENQDKGFVKAGSRRILRKHWETLKNISKM